MNLRWLEKEDGTKVLQESSLSSCGLYVDIPTVKEERKAREFWIQPSDLGEKLNAMSVMETDNQIDFITLGYIKVREVLEGE